ncbi:MAG TPA: biotin--[acetyl-CoA-carboxylase] ligase [Burkholderiales bacterium]|nr:biotin--[acetyl-CoA-carboxylase] ligase [Burkholderiales bacterium]
MVLHDHLFTALRRLNRGHAVPAIELARALGSPAAAAAALEQLSALGVETTRDAQDNYCLARPFDALDAQAISRALDQAAASYRVAVLDTSASTNSDILPLTVELPAHMAQVLAAELQTAGRGRRGRAWVSGLGTSLTFSVLRRFEGSLTTLSGLSLAAGLAVALALEELGAQGVKLKWPNDILLQQGDAYAKLGGILIELSGETAAPARAVIGIGLNVRLPQDARARVGGPGAQPVADLAQAGLQVARNRLLAAVLRHLHSVLDSFAREGFAALRGAWNLRHAYQGAEVRIINEGRVEQTGVVQGVDAGGALRLATPAGIVTVVSGELSLRPAA